MHIILLWLSGICIIMERVRLLRAGGGFMKEEFTAGEQRFYEQEINKDNYKTLRFFSYVWMPLSVVNIFSQGLAHVSVIKYSVSAIMLVYFIAVGIFDRIWGAKFFNKATRTIYVVQVFPLVLAILLGTLLDPARDAITIFLFLAFMPVLILDKPRNVLLWMVFWTVVFLACSWAVKEPNVFMSDFIHALEFGIVSAAAIVSVTNNRMTKIHHYIKALSSVIDPLTGLQTMTAFEEKAREVRDETNQELSIAYFNIAGLKKFNEHHGYQAGNDLLCNIASLLGNTFEMKYCSRFADDHFVVIQRSSVINERIEEVLKKATSLGKNCPVQAGIYALKEGDILAIACDRAKSAVDSLSDNIMGKNIQYYDEAFQKAEEHKHYIQYHLEEAIEKGWIKTYYQPIIRGSTNKVCNVEALARWIDPNLGFLSPGEFIPILESFHKLHALDLEIVRQAVQAVAEQLASGFPVSPVSVNLSRYDFENADMVAEIIRIVDEAGVDHGLVVIEITESALLNQEELISKEIIRFHDAGFQVWMDDFGSGWSSLNLLTQFPFDQIKLDMQFAFRINDDPRNKLVVKHMVELAQQMGIDTLIEGIETKEQYLIFKEIGCDKMQGYYYSKPVPLEELQRLIKEDKLMFEQFDERHYYSFIGEISFMDALANRQRSADDNYGIELPMAILELEHAKELYVLRANEPFVQFIEENNFANGSFADGETPLIHEAYEAFETVYCKALTSEQWQNVGETIVKDVKIRAFARKIGHNPLTGRGAFFLAIIR